jgi:adenylate kinase
MILLFIGPSGSGKDTQVELIKESKNFEVVSTGDLLRKEMASGSELGKEVQKTVDAGIWTPDELVYRLVSSHIENSKSENFILVGVVRRPTQVELLDNSLSKINKKLDKVILFDLSEEEAIDRLSHRVTDPKTGTIYHQKYNPAPEGLEVIKRDDDKPEAIRSRMSEHRNTIEPIVEKYKARGMIEVIDAAQSVEDINKQVVNIIENISE